MLKKMEFDVIINATPVGMDGNRDPLPISEAEFKARYFFDMVYTPAETKMVRLARAKGMHVILGSEMFVQQGVRQFETWSGKPAPVLEMQRVVDFALAQRDAKNVANNQKRSKAK
jgi:3-dehydroquinate dehydratase/shikimate dehydrogenase